ncbi:MAG: hypothetical protein NTU93_10525 [Arthrobacter sp.]|nr:hypothetical protein [Arthrobacter sp.]
MEQHQEFTAVSRPAAQQWEVTYLDTDCGRVRTEAFEDAAEAERFASRQVRDEDGWAMIDPVRPRQARAAA